MSDNSHRPLAPKKLAQILLFLWLGLAFYTVLFHLSGVLTVHDYDGSYLGHLRFLTTRVWLPWVLLTPIVIAVGGRLPITPANWYRQVPLHGAILVLLSVIEVGAISLHYHFFADLSETMAKYAPWQHIGHFLFGDSLFLFNTIIYALLIASMNIRNFSRLAEQKALVASELNNRLMASQLQALRMQINPHFLFNTLNVISVLVMKGEQDQARQMINRLSRYFRQTLEEKEQQWIPLRKELEHTGLYLAIEQVRFGERLTVVEEFDPEAMAVSVPSMLLQPLVENAMSHGLGEKEGPGCLVLHCRREAGYITLAVTDDGVGCDFDDPERFREGIGLSNVRQRLRQLYGRDHEFSINSGPEGGVEVVMRLPVAPAERKLEQLA